jgi:hypothetical protein
LREISRSEAIVTAELLAGQGLRRRGGEDERIPRRTRQAVRQRLLARDSIRDRYVPDPAALGRPIVTFVIAQPYADKHSESIAKWRLRPEGVDVWAFKDTSFGVFFLPGLPEAATLRADLGGSETYRTVFAIDCDSRAATVPVFFDFEAAWTQITGLQGTLAYPHSLPFASVRAGNRSAILQGAEREALCHLLARRDAVDSPEDSRGWMSRLTLSSRERRLLEDGTSELRTFLDPAACSRWAGDFPDTVVFIGGGLVDGRTAPELFRSLLETCRINPFLFATDGTGVLFGCLSTKVGDRGNRSSSQRAPVLPTIREFLQQIVVHREPIESLTPLVDHRYDRPFHDAVET